MRLLILACVAALSSCMCRDLQPIADEPEQPRWMASATPHTRGVFVVVHGLNQRPSAMDPLAHYLSELGFHTYRMTLEGHRTYSDETFPASSWKSDVRSAIAEARSRYPSLPLYLMGYSLGGLLVADVLEEDSSVEPRKIVLLAPALSLRTYVLAARALAIFPFGSLKTMSLAPPGYRRFRNTPLFWYENTIDLYDETASRPAPVRLRRVPALIVVSPDDELVSPPGLREWVDANSLPPAWQVELIEPQPHDERLHRHLIVDRVSLGDAEWQRLQDMLKAFLADS
jgi:esterase/lipase